MLWNVDQSGVLICTNIFSKCFTWCFYLARIVRPENLNVHHCNFLQLFYLTQSWQCYFSLFSFKNNHRYQSSCLIYFILCWFVDLGFFGVVCGGFFCSGFVLVWFGFSLVGWWLFMLWFHAFLLVLSFCCFVLIWLGYTAL